MQIDQIGQGIATRRKQLGLSQEELARKIGVTRQAVSRWESGSALPSVDNMIELSHALEVSVDELLQLSPQPRESALSAQSIGLLLDEHTARQEKRFKRLTIALGCAALLLVIGLVISTTVGLRRTNQMETYLNNRISSSIANLNAYIGTTVQQAVSDGNSHLAASDYSIEYDHPSRSFLMALQAYPQVLGEYSDAVFAFELSDSTRLSGAAELIDGRFQGVIAIPDHGQDLISGCAYISWQENGETITETVRISDTITALSRLEISWVAMNTSYTLGENVTVKPYVQVDYYTAAPDCRPVSIRYDIYAGEELAATLTEDTNVQQVLTSNDWGIDSRTFSPDKITLEGVTSTEGLLLRVTVTDAMGREFSTEYVPGQP